MNRVDIAFRHTFSVYDGPGRTLRRVVKLNVSQILASKRRTATRGKVPLLGRLIRRTSKQVVVVPKYNIGTNGVHGVTRRAKASRFRFSKHDDMSDNVVCHGSGMSVKNAMGVRRCLGSIASPSGMGTTLSRLTVGSRGSGTLRGGGGDLGPGGSGGRSS